MFDTVIFQAIEIAFFVWTTIKCQVIYLKIEYGLSCHCPPNLNNSWSSFIFFLHNLTVTFQHTDRLRDWLIPIKYVLNFKVCSIFLGLESITCVVLHKYMPCIQLLILEMEGNRKIKVNSYVLPTFLPYVTLKKCLGLIKFD